MKIDDVTIWICANWNTAPKEAPELEAAWPHWQRVIGQVRAAGINSLAVNIAGGVERTKALAERFLTQWPTTCPTCGTPGPAWTFGVSTAEVFGSTPLDGDPAHWAPLLDLIAWLKRQGSRVIVDFEGSLLPVFRGEKDFDLDQFRRNCETLVEVAPVLVYPTMWNGFNEPLRLHYLMALLRAGVEPTLIGTTYHSPGSLQRADNVHVRQIERAACYPRVPAEQIIVGTSWFAPEQVPDVLRMIPPGAEPFVWFQTDFLNQNPTVSLVPATLEAIKSAMSTPQEINNGT